MAENQTLSSQEVNNTLMFFEEFSQALNSVGINPYSIGLRNKFFTPDLINEALKGINNNPQKPSSAEAINQALSAANTSEKVLRDYATYFEINNIGG